MKPLKLFTIGIFLSFSSSYLLASEKIERSIDYSEINKIVYIATNKVRSPLVYLNANVVLNHPELKIQDVKLFVSNEANERKDVVIDHNLTDSGYLMTLPSFPLEHDELKLTVNQPKDHATFSINLGINPPSSKEMTYYELFVLLDDINDFTGEMAGAMSWFVSDMDELKFEFEEPSTITILSKDSQLEFNTDESNELVLEKESSLFKSDAKVIFSSLPKAVLPQD
ncbi:hypothetical protein [Pleionea litopenaei]|uniref:DUF2987 domain-containing protein n=1 Tax=Pleionea litopenaei TaxID=3070815 RepID=A0AA51X5L7_9GAMM|nr:hypothetical protein [Pleionea sp. HL-JVS1]WMS86108.1 hypothetical protein Q9312_12855 [Pleionea sp. HL-JVS1]